jgi:hypothetical protein
MIKCKMLCISKLLTLIIILSTNLINAEHKLRNLLTPEMYYNICSASNFTQALNPYIINAKTGNYSSSLWDFPSAAV